MNLQTEVRFFAQLRRIAAAKSLRFSLPAEATVQQLLDDIVKQIPLLKPHLMDERGEVHAHVRILVNGIDIQHAPDGIHTHLKQEDVVSIFPAIGGG